ncbi:DNA mismatch repair protein MutS [Pedobacter sp. Leaf194]|uniref:MutS-related protein n=1 Tax=Pedobacter sp. Leaf194 TaxID=1736297 RepID=UPI000702E0CC|nr:DNA mismatch repair protein MutS [Pedobacter sp. Leaf194]KQS41701.1 DNA mismatch repair protein MutS [Pedobacter sp. Leaf194]
MSQTDEQIRADYLQKVDDATKQIGETKTLIDRLSLVRIGLFLVEILLFVLLLNSPDNGLRTLIQICLAIPVLCFVFIVRRQSRLDKKLSFEKKLLWIFQNELNISNGLENGYDNGQHFQSDVHPYSSDLDIFGDSSLFALANRCSTKTGNETLAAVFSQLKTVDEINLRQDAIKEMAAITDKTFEFRAHLLGYDAEKIELITEQLSNKLASLLTFTNNTFFRFYVSLVPFLTIFLLSAGIIYGGIFWKFFAFLFFAHIGWNSFFSKKVDLVFYSFSGSSSLLNEYSKAIKWTESQRWESAFFSELSPINLTVSKEINSLSKIIQNFDSRLNLMIGSLLNALFLWDFRCCIQLEKWLKSSSENVSSSLNNLGHFEEIISLATLTYNSPSWTFPKIEQAFSLSATSLGHPLIKLPLRVVNDFSCEKIPTVDIITGSNMAGKSTFLRTVGINMVLAYSGAAVCAADMKLSIFALNTYMRIKDSLNESTSTFKAELNRLKMILMNVKRNENTFVLIDEMLRGTNSRDKYLGSKVFIEKLLELKRAALFATHDLQLADMQPEHEGALRNFHFDISIIDGNMRFDYKLKTGPCATFNAAILLKEIGLALD